MAPTEPDNGPINVREPIGLRAWAARLGFTEEEIVEAVNAVGADAAAVNIYLKAKIPKP